METSGHVSAEPPSIASGGPCNIEASGVVDDVKHDDGIGEMPPEEFGDNDGGIHESTETLRISSDNLHNEDEEIASAFDEGHDDSLHNTLRLSTARGESVHSDAESEPLSPVGRSSDIGSSAAEAEEQLRTGVLQPYALRRASPQKPQHVLLMDREERMRMVRANSDRKVWHSADKSAAQKRSSRWNERHQLTYTNDGLNPSYRSYFDRFLDYREPKAATLGKLKPQWKLSPEGSTSQERDADKATLLQFSPCYHPPAAQTPSKPARRVREEADHVFDRLYLDAAHKRLPSPPGERQPRPLPGGGGSASTGSIVARAKVDDEASSCESGSRSDVRSDNGSGGVIGEGTRGNADAEDLRGSWDNRHHVTWSNDRQIGNSSEAVGRVMNPVLLRSYFDRTRTPLNSRCEESRQEGAKVVPVWRLDPLGPRQAAVELTKSATSNASEALSRSSSVTESAAHERTVGGLTSTASRTVYAGPGGGGGDAPSPKLSQASQSSPPVGDRGLPLSNSAKRREKSWQDRHQLTFKNEEVSRLDRNYFDRFRETEALMPKMKQEVFNRSTLVWSLAKSGSPEIDAKKVCESADARFNADGKWMARHHHSFANDGLQPNLRSFFDRHREPENLAGGKLSKRELADLSLASEGSPSYEHSTQNRNRARRGKLAESEKLPVQWKLPNAKIKGQKKQPPFEQRLRESNSDGSVLARSQQRRQDAWFSSHGVAF
eukprot:TRINITY_DN24839_c0_g1_i1.p1 TRINITY_DN24839_c0_g1~~TRINITY_DN24839_c0_g1_i1.p1  ORF type:complete len:719 (-),score=116.76 TRINITY_DN24839_c0_g1_i1:146-2302(-)